MAKFRDDIDRSIEAQGVGKRFEILPEAALPGLYEKLRALALRYLEPVNSVREKLEAGDLMRADHESLFSTLEPSQQSAFQMLRALDDLLAVGTPQTDHARTWRAQRQRAVINWMHRLNATAVERDRGRQDSAGRGGTNTALTAKANAQQWQAQALQVAREMLAAGKERRDLAQILAKRFDRTPRTIRALLNKAEV